MNWTWLAYERTWSGEEHTIIKKSDERHPSGGFQLRGPATPEEIKCELKKRSEVEKNRILTQEYDERQDVKDARSIRDIIEWMAVGDGVVDRLTPAEWAEFRRRLV